VCHITGFDFGLTQTQRVPLKYITWIQVHHSTSLAIYYPICGSTFARL
jgi:hypothetical protein